MRLKCFAVFGLALLIAGCAANQRRDALEKTLEQYAALIRWNEFAAATDYYDPELRDSDPITSLELRRLQQFRVANYDVRSLKRSPGGMRARQTVEIHLYNIHTQTAEVIVDHQTWRYDPEAERWWLTSGLPDVTRRR